MTPPDVALERRYLLASIAVAALLGGLGIGWGIASRSQMILLDGAYALVGIVLSVVLLRASSLASRAPSKRYPFGMGGATALAVGAQGLVLLATLLYASYEAVLSIRSGGTSVTVGWAIAYGVIATFASAAFAAWIGRAPTSDVIEAETVAWKVAAWSGAGVIVGFSLLALAEVTGPSHLVPYVDPIMVLVSCVLLVREPLKMIRATGVELLEGAPDESVLAPVKHVVTDTASRHGLGNIEASVAKLGPKLYVDVSATAPGDLTLRQEQSIREEIDIKLEQLPYDVWLTLELSVDDLVDPGKADR